MDESISIVNDGYALLQPYPYLIALIVISASIVLAKIVDYIFSRIIMRLVARTTTNVDDYFVSLLHRPIFTTVASIGLFIALGVIGLEPDLKSTIGSVIQTVLVFVWLIFALRASGLFLNAMSRHKKRFEFVQPTTEPLLKNAFAVLIFLTGIYTIMVAWNINVTGLVASAGIVGLALSFAAQDTLSNLFAGVAILADKPYQIGDVIIIDNGERGEVTHIGLRSTRLLTRDDVEISIPNSVMGNATIINEAGGPPRRYRVRASVGVAYGSDINKVMQILEQIAATNEGILKFPTPRVRFRLFGESSLDFDLLCWIDQPVKRGLIVHELNCEIYRQFAESGVEIPFPQRDLHVKEMPENIS
ncbi:MAG: mechanosensitive ion channel family protein, partial [Gammaproteobacteria bacterium]|nr:mechanosensitive ion channel family protein [Gammaproteobacteria bacterium]